MSSTHAFTFQAFYLFKVNVLFSVKTKIQTSGGLAIFTPKGVIKLIYFSMVFNLSGTPLQRDSLKACL